jgi:uncharacterized protein
MQSSESLDLVIRRTPIGLGLFTRGPIPRGSRVAEYTGPLVSNRDHARLKGRYLFEVNSRWTIDGAGRGNLARYINHSCRPNCEAVVRGKRIFIYAKKRISPGEELAYDYGKAYFDEFIKPKGCACPRCTERARGGGVSGA